MFTVTGTLDQSGGTVTFYPQPELFVDGASKIWFNPISATIADDGEFSAELPHKEGLSYRVMVYAANGDLAPRFTPFGFAIPADDATVNLSTLVPVQVPVTVSPELYVPVGVVGPKGDKGDKGADGRDGTDGTNGIDGLPGPKGDKGDKGDTGLTGPKGDTGLTGPKGDKGDPGTSGSSPAGPPIFVVQGFYCSTDPWKTANTGNTPAANSGACANGYKFTLGRGITIDQIGVELLTVGGAGSADRFGLYASDADGWAGTKLWDSGSVQTASATGIRNLPAVLTLPAGEYWFVSARMAGAGSVGAWRAYSWGAPQFNSVNGFGPSDKILQVSSSADPVNPLPATGAAFTYTPNSRQPVAALLHVTDLL